MRIGLVGSTARRLAIGAFALGAAAALPQSAKPVESMDPGLMSPAVRYEPPLSDYRPFKDQSLESWQEANRVVASAAQGHGHAKSSRAAHGMAMPGTDSNSGEVPRHHEGSHQSMAAPKAESAAGHGMHSSKQAPAQTQTRKEHHAAVATGRHDKESHASVAPGRHETQSGHHAGGAGALAGTGVVRGIDKAGGKVRLTHDPIAALGWPRMTLLFRLKDRSLADQVKEGERVEFSLERSASGYLISRFAKAR